MFGATAFHIKKTLYGKATEFFFLSFFQSSHVSGRLASWEEGALHFDSGCVSYFCTYCSTWAVLYCTVYTRAIFIRNPVV